ncbi:TonB-dependent receptor domain-containing protein [Alteromonas gilva]|uniref:TonB-dependent receptor n=1 Tax=Alteromonas gilva TaxID=2987522 RepID=A0ABT5L026_9ALTE|nr:TonB-dependent receptor [Alteromonas gilva]MDC8830233.1 TonB-dependent receptor [Alteromonas gilva]
MNNKKFPLSLIAIAVLGIHTSSIAANIQESEISVESTQDSKVKTQDASEQPESPEIEDRILVTGSRLKKGNVVNKLDVITAEDIKRRGVTSVEELIRTLPQNLATIGGMANLNPKGPLAVADNTAGRMSTIGALGVSAANLGGVGAGRTLILVNGRRIAGAAGIEDGFVNLNGIPLSAIERVEITTDGASAVYGADAMGGVINFILKSGYSGSTVTVQHEDSNNGADNSSISLYTGRSWTSGNVSLTLDYSKRKPVINSKTGYVTNNYAPYFNDNPFYDRRSFSAGGQPAFVDNSITVYNPDTGLVDTLTQAYTVPDGFTGQPTLDDMTMVDGSAMRDYVPRLGGPDSESKSVSVSFEQQLTEHLSINGNGLYTKNDTSQDQINFKGIGLALAPGQAYNPFPAYYVQAWSPGITAFYHPEAELAAGEVEPGYSKSTNDAWSFNLGLTYEINKDTKAEFIYSSSRSTTTGERYATGSIVSINKDTTNPNGWSCFNFDLAQGNYTGDQLAFYQDLFDRQCEALTSSDPTVAFNPWKSSVDGSGGSFDPFYYREATEQRGSKLENYELRLTGSVFKLPAGKINYAIGGEYNDDGVDSNEIAIFTGQAMHRTRESFFIETSIPVFGRDFTFPLLHSLTLSLAARRDEYNTEGVIGTVDNINPDLGGELIYGKNTFAKNTPSYGFNWQPTDDITFRAKWSEGFKAPPYTNMFSVAGTTEYSTQITNDPGYDCRENNDCDFDYRDDYYGYYASRVSAPNPDLKPETSKQEAYTLSWYPQDALAGLTVDVTYNKIKIENEYAVVADLIRLIPQSSVYALEQYYPRDENGKITEMRNMTFNQTGSEFSSIMYEVGYFVRTEVGTFNPRITYLDNLKSEIRAISDSTPLSRLGRIGGVDDYRINASLNYYFGDLTTTLWVYYLPNYINDNEAILSSGNVTNPEDVIEVSSMTTFDLTVNYQLTNDLRVNFSGRNIFDKTPPMVVVGSLPYDAARYNTAGRTLSMELQYEF